MKATIEILDSLRQAARHLARDGVAMCGRIIGGLHRALAPRKETDFHLRDASFLGEGLHDGVTAGSWQRMRDLAYEGRGT